MTTCVPTLRAGGSTGGCSRSNFCCEATEGLAGRLEAIHQAEELDWKQVFTYACRPMHFYEDSLSRGGDKRALGNGNLVVQWKK